MKEYREISVGQKYPASDSSEDIYTVRDLDGHLVEVSRDPHPSWAHAAWIEIAHFADVADLSAPLSSDTPSDTH